MANFKYYEKDGKKYERFSTVADFFPHPKLVDWKIKLGRKESGLISRAALRVGSRVDELCTMDICDGGYKLEPGDLTEVKTCMKAWEQWKTDYPLDFSEITDTQKTVYYDDWGVAGTADIVGVNKLVDIKTSKKISLINWVQLGFYNRGFCLETWVLRLDKSLWDYEYKRCPEEYSQEYLEEIFLSMLNVFNYYKSEEGKK